MNPPKILLITHEEIGKAMIETAEHNLQLSLKHIDTIPIYHSDDPETIFTQLQQSIVSHLAEHKSFLILTDLVGATPCNISQRLLNQFGEDAVSVITGLNLPMLLKVINYQTLPLPELTEKAVIGGREGVDHQHCQREKSC